MGIAIAGSVALLYGLVLARSPLARVRTKLALAWMLAIIFFPAILWCAYDDARKGKVLVATAEAAGDVWMLTRWVDWRDRLRARRNALRAASRARRREWQAALAEQRKPVPHQPNHWKWSVICMLTWLAIIPIALGSLLLIPVLADAPRATLTAAASAIVLLWAAWIWSVVKTRQHYWRTWTA